jgi:hypothetical protein
MGKSSWNQLPIHKKIKYLAEIVAIMGGLFLIGLNVYQLRLFRDQLTLNNNDFQLNRDQLKINERQLKINEGGLKLFGEQIGLERSKKEAQLECRMWRNFYVSIHERIVATDSVSLADEKTVPTVKGIVPPKQPVEEVNKDRMEVVLLCRNRSPRATAIVDVFVRDDKGENISGRGYNNRIKLPIQIEPWGLIQNVFEIENRDQKKMKTILIRDMEDNECILDPGLKWVKAKRK